MRHIVVLLALVLGLLVGCGPATPRATAPAPTNSPPPTATAAETVIVLTPTEPAPASTEQPQAAMGQASATAAPAGGREIVVLSRGERLIHVDADGSTELIEIERLETTTFQVKVSPDGMWIAGPVGESDLVLYNRQTGEAKRIGPQAGRVGEIHFAPGSDSLVFAVTDYNTARWELIRWDIQSGEIRSLGQGVNTPLPYPLAWTEQGIVATQIMFYAADAGVEGLYLIDVDNGGMQPLREPDAPFIQAVASPPPARLAIVEGLVGLGIENPSSGLIIQALGSGETTRVEQEAEGLIGNLHWSPDGSKLIYNRFRFGVPSMTYTIVGPETAPRLIELSPPGGTLLDLGWYGDEALLLLVDHGTHEGLYLLQVSPGGAGEPREIAALEGAAVQGGSQILYIGQ